ncbi:tubulin-specific chaperone E [Diabrotica virgifera virgifera]|uniref:Tubulin-specific chaperone E n=1 Tax=Diabrotica virgifera virgifera TaxID=50390 RepID=A0A6P7GT66_DIAVI|nr:tubulin-specific chaperone E [Diabrotica virgifera virgifera]
MVAQTSDTEYKVGKRIECNDNFGSIKYVGPVEGYPGNWLGIDWDDKDRGKHNGTVNGIRYFHARYPKSGSLVRKEKVNLGQKLIDSVRTRYGFIDNEDSAKKNKEEMMKFQQMINAPFLEFVGFDEVAEKQRNFQSLEVINVRLQNVSIIGDLMNLCPNVREIDISKNLLSSWNDVFSICSQLRHLYWINLSENLLSMPDNTDKHVYPNITVLVCGSMELTFEDVTTISAIFPNVEELRVPYNHITNLTIRSDHNFRRLKYLDLEGNEIRRWSEINKLSVIKTLEHMTIENIKLESIRFEENSIPVNCFNNLETLNLNDNLLSEWRSIGELNKLEKFRHLRLLKNPVLETENLATREQIIIAKIKHLQSLNGRHIRDDERRGAEYDYIKKYALEWMKIENAVDRENFLLEHNRFLQLIEMYGLPEEAELIVKPNIIQSSLVNLIFRYNGTEKIKSLPQNILVQKLILLVKKMFKLRERPVLIYSSALQPDIKIELCDEFKELHYYSVQDGDTIIVQDF